MADDVIKSFLVSLNYKVDDSSKKKFEESTEKAEKNISAFAKTMTVASLAFVAGVTKIASEMEKMQFMSQRVGASSGNIKSFQYAISQMGGSATEAASSIESLAQKLRTSPGYYGLLNRIGVQTRTANGGLRDTVDIVSDLSKSLNKMDYPRANAYANVLGIDERTLLAIRDGSLVEQMNKYKEMRKSIGLGDETSGSGHNFMTEFRDTTTLTMLVLEKLSNSVIEILLPVLKDVNEQLIIMSKWFNSLDSDTKDTIKNVAKWALAFAAVTTAATLLTGAIKALILPFKLLSSIFISSPIGLAITTITALATAISVLWSDYTSWKEGGETFIDWDKWGPGLEKAVEFVGNLWDSIKGATGALADFLGMRDRAQNSSPTKTSENDPKFGKQLSSWIGGTFTNSRKYLGNIGSVGSSIIGSLIGSGEGGYNSYNRGYAGDARGKTIDFSQMTVGEVMALQSLPERDRNRLFAVGKYQVIPKTLQSAVNSLGIDKGSKFTPELQEHIAHNYLFSGKRPAIKRYITGNGSIDSAVSDLAMEFASVADPNTGKSYYHDRGGNRASISAEQAANALASMKQVYLSSIDAGSSPEAAWQSLGAGSLSESISGMTQTNNITINGASNTEDTRKAVTGAINDSNARLQRNSSVSVR